jgi:YXWGXW repeat-containing protein
MSIKTAVLCVALGIGAGLAPSIGSARTYVDIDVAPPPPREEVMPGPRRGYEWAPGYWNYHGRHHVWVRGHWVHARRGHHWVPAHWEERHGRWHFEAGHWD